VSRVTDLSPATKQALLSSLLRPIFGCLLPESVDARPCGDVERAEMLDHDLYPKATRLDRYAHQLHSQPSDDVGILQKQRTVIQHESNELIAQSA